MLIIPVLEIEISYTKLNIKTKERKYIIQHIIQGDS